MSLGEKGVPRAVRPLAVELGAVTAVLAGVYLWAELLRRSPTGLPAPVAVPASGAALLAGVAALVGGYAALRDIEVGLSLPAEPRAVALAALVPAALAGLTKAVGAVTGVAYNSLTMTAVPADPALGPLFLLTAASLVVGVPALVLVNQVLVQGSLERAVGDGPPAVVLTALVGGLLTTSATGGLAAVPEGGRLLGAAVLAALLGVGVLLRDRLPKPHLAYAPAAAFVVLALLSGVAGTETLAGGLFALAGFATLAVAADAYERTDSLLAPALAYASLLLSNRAIVLALEAGVKSW
jgi:hypothetical protein